MKDLFNTSLEIPDDPCQPNGSQQNDLNMDRYKFKVKNKFRNKLA